MRKLYIMGALSLAAMASFAPAAEAGADTPVETSESKSIVPEKYRGKYKGASDWIGEFMEGQAKSAAVPAEKDKEGKVTKKAVPAAWIVAKIMKLGEINGIDTSKYGEVTDENTGRMRMTIGNGLRARAKRRHGLKGIDGTFVKAPKPFLESIGAPEKPTEDNDGKVIVTNDGKKKADAKAA